MKHFVFAVIEFYLVFGTMGAYANGNIGFLQFAIQLGLGVTFLTLNLKRLDEQNA